MDRRSFISAVIVTFQPWPGAPTRWVSGTNTPSRKTSLNSAPPSAWRMGRTVTPGERMSIQKLVRPSNLGTFGSVRASTMP